MDETILAKIVLENAKHIATINGELSGVLNILSLHTKLILGLFGFLGTIFITNLFHIRVTKKTKWR